MILQAQDDGASNLYWRLVRRHQVKRDWNKITGCESRSEEAGPGPEARLGSCICHSSDGSLCEYGAATSESLIVRRIHRHCQFHIRVIQEAGSAPLHLSEYVVGVIGQDVNGAKHVLAMISTTAMMSAVSTTRGDCRLSPHEAFSYDICANTAPISEVGGRLASSRGDAPLRLTRRPL